MTSIWGFLLQTLTVSLAAALLLLVKELLGDKLSPRWQCGIWSVLALRILLPARVTRAVLLPLALWIETLKGLAEKSLSSAFAAVYSPVSVRFPVPYVTDSPVSVTDWIFVIYTAGVVVMLAWYLFSWLRLRGLLRRGGAPSGDVMEHINNVCEKYGLHPRRVVTMSGLPSAFVCGVIRPVLVIPAGEMPDEKIILHELLHLRHRDAFQSVIWCVFRCLHWCNPFLQYVFNRIGNDMEALCDQRVLELLEGEERRDYGGILLSMANERYPRAPGTTSVSNGGKNISRRIKAIVRFKKYPKGMALVSICIAFVLACPVLAGTASGYAYGHYHPAGEMGLERALAVARIQRCTTVAGALDTYAKGLMFNNGIYIAMASPLESHEALAEEMRSNLGIQGWSRYYFDSGAERQYGFSGERYYVYNLKEDKRGGYSAFLAFLVNGLSTDEESESQDEYSDIYVSTCILIPVSLRYEYGWVVEETGPHQAFPGADEFSLGFPDFGIIPSLEYYEASGESGTVSISVSTVYTVDNTVDNNMGDGVWWVFPSAAFDENVKPAAEFYHVRERVAYEYTFGGDENQRESLSSAAIEVIRLSSDGENPEFSDSASASDTSWSSSTGASGASRRNGPDWDGTVSHGSSNGDTETKDGLVVTSPGYAVRIYWDYEPVEDFILTPDGGGKHE